MKPNHNRLDPSRSQGHDDAARVPFTFNIQGLRIKEVKLASPSAAKPAVVLQSYGKL